MKVTIDDIRKAREIIAPAIRRTPIEASAAASSALGAQAFLKCENLQLTGSFKIRGAFNKISQLSADEKARGVIGASAGNHAQGVALSATKLGVKSVIVMPRNSSIVKQQATRNYGAEVVLHGDYYDEAYAHARDLEKKNGGIFVHPYEDPYIVAGQGTIGLELYEELPDLESVIIPLGGGGLISGVATALKALNPKLKIYGVVAENAPGMMHMFLRQNYSPESVYVSIADGIAVKKPSSVMYESFIRPLVDEIISVNEDEISYAIAFLLERAKMVVEGSGAVTLAAAMKKQLKLGAKTCLLLSGGNIDMNLVGEIIDRGLSRSGRVTRTTVIVDDRPGTLQLLTRILAEQGANILDVQHDRTDPALRIRETRISFVLETIDASHAERIRTAMRAAQVRVIA